MGHTIPLKTLAKFAHDVMSAATVAHTLAEDLARDKESVEEHRAIAAAAEKMRERVKVLQGLIEALSTPAIQEEISPGDFFAIAKHAIPSFPKPAAEFKFSVEAATLSRFFTVLRDFLKSSSAELASGGAWTWTLPHPPVDSLDLALAQALAARSNLSLNLHGKELTLLAP